METELLEWVISQKIGTVFTHDMASKATGHAEQASPTAKQFIRSLIEVGTVEKLEGNKGFRVIDTDAVPTGYRRGTDAVPS